MRRNQLDSIDPRLMLDALVETQERLVLIRREILDESKTESERASLAKAAAELEQVIARHLN